MLGLCIFASHWLVAGPAAFEGPLTGFHLEWHVPMQQASER